MGGMFTISQGKRQTTNVGLYFDYNYVSKYVYIQEKRKQKSSFI